MGCFTFRSTETVMVFAILLLVTTPILSFLKFLDVASAIIVAFSFQLKLQARDLSHEACRFLCT